MSTEWEEGKFATWKRKLGNVGHLSVEYTEHGYRVTVLGARLVKLSPTLDEAQNRANNIAGKWLESALAELRS